MFAFEDSHTVTALAFGRIEGFVGELDGTGGAAFGTQPLPSV